MSTASYLRDFKPRSASRAVYTTGQIAKICRVAPRTVSKWFDSGRLKGYRIPGSQDRRVTVANLVRFMTDHGLPMGDLESAFTLKLLIVGASPALVDQLRELLPDSESCRVESAESSFEAGMIAATLRPGVIALDTSLGRLEAGQMIAAMRRAAAHLAPAFLALCSDEPAEALREIGFDAWQPRAAGPAAMAVTIRGLFAERDV